MYNGTMKTYRDMLKTILDSSGWTQQQLAVKLGVSFPTVNYWLNNKVTPHKKMQKRIKDLYLARNVPYEGPVFITFLTGKIKLKPGDQILLFKTPEDGKDGYKVIGIKRDDFTKETPNLISNDYNIAIQVANTTDTVAKGTKPGFRIYDRINTGAYANIMFVLNDSAIAVIEDWGLEINN